MASFPITPSTGDPIFRGISSSIDSVRRFSRMGSDSAVKLNTQERVVSPGEDALGFAASRGLRSQLGGLRAVQESGQINVTTLNLAIEGLESIRGQLDGVKRLLVQSQAATAEERAAFQAEVDLAIKQIDATAQNTKVSGRGLLNGESSIRGYQTIAATTGQATEFTGLAGGQSLAQTAGVQAVRVNQIGVGGPTVRLDDGSLKLSLRVCMVAASAGVRQGFAVAGGAAGGYSDFRITGKLGSATVRIASTAGTIPAAQSGNAAIVAFNALSAETGVAFAETAADTFSVFSVGAGNDDFVKVEYLGGTANGATIGGLGGGSTQGQTAQAFGRAGVLTVNGQRVSLGGEFGTTARYQQGGYDIEIDLSTSGITGGVGFAAQTINIRLDDGTAGLLGSAGRTADSVRYGVGTFTAETLGKGNGQNSAVNATGVLITGNASTRGNFLVGNSSVADLGSGGPLQLASGKVAEAIRTIDRAVAQVVKEQSRLGVLQANFMDAISRAEVAQGNISAADADILGVDAASEITNLVQAQVGVATATALSSQITGMQQAVLSMLRG